MQRPHCARHPQAAQSQNSCDYAQSLLEHMYGALAITYLYMLVKAEGREHSSVKDDEQEEGKIKKGEETIDGGNAVNNPNPVQRYQLSNNIESATLELDENADIISYEEYYPYGDTSYQAGTNASEVSQKRYRYMGKEKDEESGLYYVLARYYSGWLGRWTAADPTGLVDGTNLYMYCRRNPVGMVDMDGRQSGPSPDHDVWGQLKGGPVDSACAFNCGNSINGESQVAAKPKESKKTGNNANVKHALEGGGKNTASEIYDNQLMELDVVDIKGGTQTVGQPGFVESFIPVWGSAREAVHNFQEGNYGWGTFHAAMAVTDVFLAGALVKVGAKAIAKGGAKVLAEEAAETGVEKVIANKAESEALYTFKESAGKRFNKIIPSGPNSGQLERPYMRSPLTIQEIMATGKGVPDATAKGALKFEVPGAFGKSQGTWELVVDPKTNVIYHFQYRGTGH